MSSLTVVSVLVYKYVYIHSHLHLLSSNNEADTTAEELIPSMWATDYESQSASVAPT